MPTLTGPCPSIVSLLGGLTRQFAANPFDVMHRLATKTSAEAYMIPVPLFANTASDRQVLASQIGVAEVFERGLGASLLVLGIGEISDESHLRETGMVTEEELAELRASGARGELLGRYFDASGNDVDVSLTARAMSPTVAQLRGRNIVAIAGGTAKVDALKAVLRSGLLRGLVTDEATARGLAGD